MAGSSLGSLGFRSHPPALQTSSSTSLRSQGPSPACCLLAGPGAGCQAQEGRGRSPGHSCAHASALPASAWSRHSQADSDTAPSGSLVNYIITYETCRRSSPAAWKRTLWPPVTHCFPQSRCPPALSRRSLGWLGGQLRSSPPHTAANTKAAAPLLQRALGRGTFPSSLPLQPPSGALDGWLRVTGGY